jgi:hypothetical protein
MRGALEQAGFGVLFGLNLSQNEMKAQIEEFGRQISRGGVGLFYFAGHGAQFRGQNYLIPVGAEIRKELDIELEGVDVQRVLNEMEAARNRLNILILDACRNNPYARSARSAGRGLAGMDAPVGTWIAYATAPGRIASDGQGRNGLYTGELLQTMLTPGVKLEDVFKRVRSRVRAQSGGEQIPWDASSIEGDFYFVPGSGPPAAAAPVAENFPDRPAASSSSAPPAESGNWVIVADRTVKVQSAERWTPTGLQVKQGQQVSIKASGSEVNLGALGYSGPDGLATNDAGKPAPQCPTGALIARLGREMICVGSGKDFAAPGEGSLELGLNVSQSGGQRGAFVAKVVVQEFRR